MLREVDLRHFNGLAALRAVAALVVVLGHTELLKSQSNLPSIVGDPAAFWPDGHLAVVLFFVLSGFLISHLLADEKERTGRISYRNFYMRRILRIWPLYYFTISLSALLLRPDYDATSLALNLTIFPNVAHALGVPWPSSPQIWSIGVEEQFYLLLPVVVGRMPVRKLPVLMAVFFVGYTLLPHVIGFLNNRTLRSEAVVVVYRFFYGSKFNCMSVGCLLGLLVSHREADRSWAPLLKCLYWTPVAYAAILLSFVLWFGKITFGYVTDEIYSILFGIMILNLATNSNLTLNLEREPFTFLGRISYGLYMYHWLVIVLIVRAMPYSVFPSDVTYNIALYAAVLAVTVFVAWLSFVGFEMHFLNKKKAYSAT